MSASQYKVVPEKDIEINPTLYSELVEQLGKVVFVLTKKTYKQMQPAWKDLQNLLQEHDGKTEGFIGDFIARHKLADNKTLLGLMAFFVVARAKLFGISIKSSADGKVRITIEK